MQVGDGVAGVVADVEDEAVAALGDAFAPRDLAASANRSARSAASPGRGSAASRDVAFGTTRTWVGATGSMSAKARTVGVS